MSPNPFLGVLLHAIGGLAAGSFYAPLRKVHRWSWESYWLLMGVAAWKAGGLEAGEYMTWWKDAPGATTYGGYHLLAIGASLAILIRGSGALSVDHALAPRVTHTPL